MAELAAADVLVIGLPMYNFGVPSTLKAYFDLQSAYVRQFLGFIGITDVEFIYAEGLAMGEESRTAALVEAGKRIEQLAA